MGLYQFTYIKKFGATLKVPILKTQPFKKTEFGIPR